ncbi:fibronectin type III domain-containing protein [Dactylosporangium sp. AC04546]|uniref:fibronectin type III domain-containing protein n=1 Tax=Dactylosporangium sp. AC04546 TaxID=2862460 RepID=UPI001EDF576A|nr:fibronectin type III domain-containing protein [Dactylosporangium sp. AC04546]WVK89065.1 fibronectin type III domain-containing protein [Dactylosporangium sp. AC04546]
MHWLRHRTVPLLLAAAIAGAGGLLALRLTPAAAGAATPPALDAARATCTTDTEGYCVINHHLGAVPSAVVLTLNAPAEGTGALPFQLAADRYTQEGFRLRALATDGKAYTGALTVSYLAYGAPAPATAYTPVMLPSGHPRRPAPPAGLTATPGDGTVRLCWQRAVNADGYDLWYRDVTNGQEWTLMPYPIADLCWTGGLFVNGHTYELKIRGANADGEGPDSAVVTVVPAAE